MPKHIENTGFRPPAGHVLGREHRSVAFAQLVTTLALAVATMAVATVLSAGVVRAAAVINPAHGLATAGESVTPLNLHAR